MADWAWVKGGTGMKSRKSLTELQQTVVPWLALAVSCSTLICTAVLGLDANSNARQALEYAKEANLIAMGAMQEYPQLKADCPEPGNVRLLYDWHLPPSAFNMELSNSGQLPIEGISIRVSPVPLGDVSLYNRVPDDIGLDSMDRVVDFQEQLAPGGVASVDLSVLILEYLRQVDWELTYNPYRAPVEVVFLPRRLGEDLPIRGAGALETGRCFYTIEFTAEFITSAEADAFMEGVPSVEATILPPIAGGD
jgi:hypothetical protein